MSLFKMKFRLAIVSLIMSACAGRPTPTTAPSASSPGDTTKEHAHGVLFIMATCPHCADALKKILPLQRDLDGALQMSYGYVSPLDRQGTPVVDLQHPETQAAAVQLCAGMIAEEAVWLEFMICLYNEGDPTQQADRWGDCAKQTGISKTEMDACLASDDLSEQLTAAYTASARDGIASVPTLFIDGTHYMGSLDKEAFLSHFCYLNGEPDTRPAVCDAISEPTRVAATLLADERCRDMDTCTIDREMSFLQALMPSMEITVFDYNSDAGRDLYEEIVAADGPHTLPTLFIQSTLDEEPAGVKHALAEYLIPFKNGFLLAMGQGFDPTREICDNGIDDTGNGLVDCDDDDCEAYLGCRKEEPNRLDLFLMSQCPFGMMLMPTVHHVLSHIRDNGGEVTFNLQFIGTVTDGEFDSLHGPSEVSENRRMVCIQELYREDDLFMDYMLCRARHYHSPDWESCVQPAMDKEAILTCATGDTGADLLTRSFNLSRDAGMRGSPGWLLNNRYEIQARTGTQLMDAYCKRNSSVACDVPIKELLVDRETQHDSKSEPPRQCR